jgi:protein phosphatase 1 regulatory subunit 7
VDRLEGIEGLARLEELWASNCQISSYDDIAKTLGDKERLTTVYFEGNPIQSQYPVLYRNKVRLALPNVSQIDAS